MKPRILLADDHRIVAEGLKNLLAADFEIVGIVEDGRQLLDGANRLNPDVIVADISMPGLNGIEALKLLRASNPKVRLIFLTMHGEPAYARRALEAGAAGFVLKHCAPEELVVALRAALAGQCFVTPALAAKLLPGNSGGVEADPVLSLTTRQREVLRLAAEGKVAKQIAAELGISIRTVEFHKYHLMETLGLRTGADLVHFAIRHGIVDL
ncbi:MAG TPA: response regulator transcription factor [Steroidobacteraceae bacterium]|jgi:DNA-binding NarL/FixJ family response regulator|nr:response regulator transcription factor [Steroidobacteraceae bacterium]